MNVFFDNIRREREYNEIKKTLAEQRRSPRPLPVKLNGLGEGARAVFAASLCDELTAAGTNGVLIIVPDEKEAIKTRNSLTELGSDAVIFPYRDFVFHNITSSHESEYERISVLSGLLSGKFKAVICTPDAALQYTVPREELEKASFTLTDEDESGQEALISRLDAGGYVRVELVDGTGQYAVRGDILDIFVPSTDNPCRIEFFGDMIDRMSFFDMLSQRTLESTQSVDIRPAREFSAPDRMALAQFIRKEISESKDNRMKSLFYEELDAVESGREINFIDKYINVICPRCECLLDYFGTSPVYLLYDYNAVRERMTSCEWHYNETVTAMLEEGSVIASAADYSRRQSDLDDFTGHHAGVILDMLSASLPDVRLAGLFSISSAQTVSYSAGFELLEEDLRSYLRGGYRVVILAENRGSAENVRNMLFAEGITATLDPANLDAGVPLILSEMNVLGFELSVSRFAVMSMYPSQSYYTPPRARRSSRARKQSKRERIMSYVDLEPGDYIVHVNHGIGMYMGLESITVDKSTRDFLKIKYAGTDVLYLPCDQLDAISKYIGAGAEEGTLKLSHMGGSDWQKAKSKVKSAARDMAKELIALYAARSRLKGFAFAPDDRMQRDFESEFEFDETDGQLVAIEEIKADMMSPQPMDRLLCGDVGFGKTEVAFRAAFKAVESGKQVAILVPTTILAMQHYQLLLSRMRNFPVSVDMLSRFRTPAQQQETVRRLRRGEVDIIVGTHRLVSSDVKFRDLGLVIIDEEQRFGVAHKEKLKQLCGNVDVLTLTATPIPRTLNMAMSGIRDMSVLEEAPVDRVPVQTYVLEYNDLIISEAIKKELRRGGQVFYLHNRVGSMDRVSAEVAAMAPGARIAIAHGQMDKEQLSDIWRSVISGDVDILVSTTIIESGIDIPNANTLIIENADRLGLSQLHQIRGRIGRSSRRAYAYFTYRTGAVLSEIAEKRLSAIRDYTEFGSGFKVAMRDLEIRGAGSILGAEQHGHMKTVGYDLYMRLLEEAIIEEKGGAPAPKPECLLSMNIDAYIPESYIRSQKQRIDAYRKIALIQNREDLSDITDELADRYGEPPAQVVALLNISLLRASGAALGFSKIEQAQNAVLLYISKIDYAVWTAIATEYKGRLLLSPGAKPYITLRPARGEKPADATAGLLARFGELTHSASAG